MLEELRKLSGVELRLELAEAEYVHATSWRGKCLREDRIKAITKVLLEKGAF